MNLVSRITFGLNARGVKASTGLVVAPTDPILVYDPFDWVSGTGASEANQSYQSESTIGTSTTTTFDFSGGGLTDAFGTAIALARVKALYIKNTGAVDITVAGNNGIVGSGFTLRPGEQVMKAAPDATAYAVSGGSTDTITLQNSDVATAASYRMVVIGVQ